MPAGARVLSRTPLPGIPSRAPSHRWTAPSPAGAYESGIADHNCDAVIDLADFAAWAACFTGPAAGPYAPGCEAFDFAFDADVDLAEVAGFQSSYAGP